MLFCRPAGNFLVGAQHLMGTLQRVQGARVIVKAGGSIIIALGNTGFLHSGIGAGGGDAEHQLGDNLSDDVGQNRAEDDADAARTQSPVGENKLLLL